jgi:hypothetical protein
LRNSFKESAVRIPPDLCPVYLKPFLFQKAFYQGYIHVVEVDFSSSQAFLIVSPIFPDMAYDPAAQDICWLEQFLGCGMKDCTI